MWLNILHGLTTHSSDVTVIVINIDSFFAWDKDDIDDLVA